MEAPTDVQKLIEQVQLLLAQSAAQNERIAALEAENAALKKALAASNARVAELERRLGLNSRWKFRRVLQLRSKLGGEEGPEPFDAGSTTQGLRLDAVE